MGGVTLVTAKPEFLTNGGQLVTFDPAPGKTLAIAVGWVEAAKVRVVPRPISQLTDGSLAFIYSLTDPAYALYRQYRKVPVAKIAGFSVPKSAIIAIVALIAVVLGAFLVRLFR